MRYLAICLLAFATAASAACVAVADACPGNPDALGTSRILEVDTSAGPAYGTWQYASTIALDHKEVVLTFDDGPMARHTNRILAALERECVKATFFVVGQLVRQYPGKLRQIAEAGHSIGTHTWSHANLRRLSLAAAKAQIEKGFRVARAAARQPISRFFRFPGMNDTKALHKYAAERGYAIISTDISSDDWMGIGPTQIVQRTMRRLNSRGRGIIVFHERPATASALPYLLLALRHKGYRIVHIVSRDDYGPVKPRTVPKLATADDNGTGAISEPTAAR